MIRVVLYQNTNKQIAEAYGKWFPRVVAEETISLDELAEHMEKHNTPFSKGAIKGILTDAVSCTKELLLMGKNVKFPDLAIFSLGLKVKSGVDKKEDFNIAKNIIGLRLRARATGELKTSNLDTTIKRIDLVTKQDGTNADTDDSKDDGKNTGDDTTPTTPGGDNTNQGGNTDQNGGTSLD